MIDESLTCRPGRPKDCVKREEIVAAATQLFMDNGYELTSMEAVARQAGVSKLTIYNHFDDKRELFRAIVQHRCDKLGMPETFLPETQLSVESALLKISRNALTNIFRPDSLRLIRVIQAEALHRPEIVRIYYEVGPRRIKTAFADLLRAFDAQGQASIPDPVRASEQFFSLLKGELLQRTLMFLAPAPGAEELEAHAQATVAFFLAAYRPSTAPTAKTETP